MSNLFHFPLFTVHFSIFSFLLKNKSTKKLNTFLMFLNLTFNKMNFVSCFIFFLSFHEKYSFDKVFLLLLWCDKVKAEGI